MKKSLLIVLLLLTLPQIIFPKAYRVLLTDKGAGAFSIGSEKYELARNSLTQRCLERRQKNGIKPAELVTIADVPIYSDYIQQLENNGCKILQKLKWYNYVVVDCDSASLEKVKTLTFVKKIIDTDDKPIHLELLSNNESTKINAEDIILTENYGYENNYYGYSYGQISEINANVLHSLGINGTGIQLGMLDNGFKWRNNPFLSVSKVIKEWDFVNSDSITTNEENDPPDQDGHGSAMFSSIAAIEPDSMIGMAPKVDFCLAKTETILSETHLEEDNYAAAVEWQEALGSDLISTSVGYRDIPINPYQIEDLDGNSCVASQYLNMASKLGMMCFTSMGNSGPSPQTLLTPADADLAISIGALKMDSLVAAEFSSRGPNASNQIKPDLSTRGVGVYVVHSITSFIVTTGGTSIACPLASGGCALLLSAAPYLTRNEALELLKHNASNNADPNNIIGWGRPDLWETIKATKTAAGELMYYNCDNYKRFVINIISQNYTAENFIYIKFADSDEFEKHPLKLIDGQYLFAADFKLERFLGQPAEVYIESVFDPIVLRKPIEKNKVYLVDAESKSIPFGVDEAKLPILSNNVAENESMAIAVYPTVITSNQNELFVELTAKETGNMKITILDIAGRERIKNESFYSGDGACQRKMDVSGLSNGMYFLLVQVNNSQKIQKFIINK
ncbi:MAG: S8 family serine peptidase [bacterium]